MRRILISGVCTVVFILQTTLFKAQWPSFGLVSPNLLLLITFVFGFMKGRKTGIIIGFLWASFIDISYSNVIGFNSILYMIVGYANGWFNKIFYDEDIALPLVLLGK